MKFPSIKLNFKKNDIKNLECLNCGKPLREDDNYCSYCSQKNTTKKLNIGTFINNIFSGFLSYDSRFWTTFIQLLIKPGKVSKDFIIGKRVRFVNPFKLYLNVSILFFLILGISNKLDNITFSENEIVNTAKTIDSIKQTSQHQIDSIIKVTKNEIEKNSTNDSISTKVLLKMGEFLTSNNNKTPKKDTIPYKYHIKTDTTKTIGVMEKFEDFQNYYKSKPNESNTAALNNLGYKPTFLNHIYYQQLANFNNNLKQIEKDGGKTYSKKMISFTSISLFIFLPVFTLFLTLLYFRKNYNYTEHLIFVFNTQTVLFLLLIIYMLLKFFFNIENKLWIFLSIFLLYLYKAMRNFYNQSRIKTILKLVILNGFYMFLGVMGVVIIALFSITAS